MTHDLDLKEFINLKTLQYFQDKFSEASEISALIVDHEGVPITAYSNCTEYCQYIHNSEIGREKCRACDKKLGMMAVTSPSKKAWHICHAGLIDVSFPVIVEDMYIGQVMCGQVLFTDANEQDIFNLTNLAEELNLDVQMLRKYKKNVRVIAKEEFFRFIDLLTIIANYLVESGINSLQQTKFHEQEIKLIEEKASRIKMEKIMKELELKTLQAQVNPHFLFNTLNTIARLAIIEGAGMTEEISYSLANLLRYSIKNINQSVCIADTLVYIKDYLSIQSMRYSDRLRYEIDVQPNVMKFELPAMILQPLVENSIVHGIEPKVDGGLIRISGKRIEDHVILEVYDTGMGLSEDTRLKLLQGVMRSTGKGHSTGIGFTNIRKRLDHFFNGQCEIDIQSEEGSWTKITIQLPTCEGGCLDHD